MLQSLRREEWMLLTAHHRGSTWCGCCLVINLSKSVILGLLQLCLGQKGALPPAFLCGFSTPLPWGPPFFYWDQPVHPRNHPEAGRQSAQEPGLSLAFPLYLYRKKWQWIMSLVTLCLWSGAATPATVQNSGTEGREVGSQDCLCSRAAPWSSSYALGACSEVLPSSLPWHIFSSSHGNELSDSQWWQSLLHKLTIFYSVAEQRVSTKEIE